MARFVIDDSGGLKIIDIETNNSYYIALLQDRMDFIKLINKMDKDLKKLQKGE